MKVCALVFSMVAVSGCGARTAAALIPKLDLRLELHRIDLAAGPVSENGQTHVVLGAQLRWSPSWGRNADVAPSYEGPVSCDLGEASCLSALYDADPEWVGELEVP